MEFVLLVLLILSMGVILFVFIVEQELSSMMLP